MGELINNSAKLVLFSFLPQLLPKAKKSLFCFFLSAFRQLIPRYWKSSTVPAILEWLEILNSIMHMEKLVPENKDTIQKFNGVWQTWITFKNSFGNLLI